MSGLKELFFFLKTGFTRFHPDRLVVQWGYIAVIFATLLLTALPNATGSPKPWSMAQPLISTKDRVACKQPLGYAKASENIRCEIPAREKANDWSAAGVGMTPTVPKASTGSEDSIDLFFKSLRKEFGS